VILSQESPEIQCQMRTQKLYGECDKKVFQCQVSFNNLTDFSEWKEETILIRFIMFLEYNCYAKFKA